MAWRDKFELGSLFFKGSGNPDWLESKKLDAVATWGATGFTLLTGILAFFGIKEGFLDRILRTDATAALWVFVLVGLGVLCALFAGVFALKYSLYSAWLMAAVLFLAAVSLTLFPNVRTVSVPGISGALAWGLGIFLVVTLVVSLIWRLSVPLTAALLVVGVAATSLGLYGAAKIAVVSKTAPESPRLTAALEHQEDRTNVKVVVGGGQLEGVPLVVVARGIRAADGTDEPAGTAVQIGRAVVVSDAVGQVDETVVFSVPAEQWSAIAVGYCRPEPIPAPERKWSDVFGTQADPEEPDIAHFCTEADDADFEERVRLTFSEPVPQVAAAFTTPETDSPCRQATVTAAGLRQGAAAHVRVVRQRAGQDETSSMSMMLPDAEGNAAMTSATVPVRQGDLLTVSYRVCTGSDDCTGPWIEVASTRVLGP